MSIIKPISYIKWLSFILVSSLFYGESYAFESMSDEDLESESGQSLFTGQYQTVGGQPGGGTLDFYRLAMDVQLDINANIKGVKLGCGGVNGAGLCDIDIDNLSLGCVTNASGNCITNGSGEIPTGMKDFVLTRPFFEFAIKNPNTLSTREFVGMRTGAENTTGPMSVTNMNRFSGYLTATANMTLEAQTDIAATCGPSTGPCNAGTPFGTNGQNFRNYNAPLQSLNLDNDSICIGPSIFINCIQLKQITTKLIV